MVKGTRMTAGTPAALLLAALLLAAAAAAAGCSDGGEGPGTIRVETPSPQAASTASPSPAPSLVAPKREDGLTRVTCLENLAGALTQQDVSELSDRLAWAAADAGHDRDCFAQVYSAVGAGDDGTTVFYVTCPVEVDYYRVAYDPSAEAGSRMAFARVDRSELPQDMPEMTRKN